MTTSKDQSAFLLDICKTIQFAAENGWRVTGGELIRTKAQQEIYFKSGLSKTMNSRHLVGMALDLNFIRESDGVYIGLLKPIVAINQLRPVGEFFESLSPLNRWGGNFDRDWSKPDSFHDVPHFERRDAK